MKTTLVSDLILKWYDTYTGIGDTKTWTQILEYFNDGIFVEYELETDDIKILDTKRLLQSARKQLRSDIKASKNGITIDTIETDTILLALIEYHLYTKF